MSRLLTDTSVIFGRYLRATLRSPTTLFFGMLQPLLFLALFGPLLAGLNLGTTGRDWQNMLIPGVLVQLAILGGAYVGLGLIMDSSFGVIDRMRVTPIHPGALLLGRVLRDVVQLLAQATLLVLLGVALGLRAPLLGVLAGLVFVGILSLGLAWLSYGLAINLSSPQQFAAIVNTAALPLMLLSGVFLPMTLAPTWLDVTSRLVPFRYTVDALRELYLGHFTSSTVFVGALVTIAFTGLSVVAGSALFRHATGKSVSVSTSKVSSAKT